jgi:PilZ domain
VGCRTASSNGRAPVGKKWTPASPHSIVREEIMDFSDQSREQRRRHRRRPVELNARVRFETREITAVAENISPGGAFLRVALPEDAEWLVADIELPEGKRLLVNARVRWRRPEPSGVGIQFYSFLERWG